jgi:hypothetical protein
MKVWRIIIKSDRCPSKEEEDCMRLQHTNSYPMIYHKCNYEICPIKEEKEGKIKWHIFKPFTAGNRQKLPPEKKYVLVMLNNLQFGSQNPIVVGYLKYHAGVKNEPYFVTPGATILTVDTDERVIAWCDCLPNGFKWFKEE